MYDSADLHPVKAERPGDLTYLTYYMVDWAKTGQSPSDVRCMQCGGEMKKVEPVTDGSGRAYDGMVCHSCKRVLWVRSG